MSERTKSIQAIHRAADALRRYEMAGRVLRDWVHLPSAQRAKWIDKALVVMDAHRAALGS